MESKQNAGQWRTLMGAVGLAALFLLLPMRARAQEPTADLCTSPAPAVLPELPLVLRVSVSGAGQIAELAAAFDLWEVHAGAGYVVVGGTGAEWSALVALGYDVSLLPGQTAQVQQAVAALRTEENACAATFEGLQHAPGLPGYTCYRTAAEIEQALYALAATWPNLARVVDFGDSWEKASSGGQSGSDLLALQIGNRAAPGPQAPFVLMASIHARELAGGETALRFAEQLLSAYGRDADTTWMLDHTVLHLLPLVNPDGRAMAETGILWRKNTHATTFCPIGPVGNTSGVDLNRNSTFGWGACAVGGCSTTYPCAQTFRGDAAGSEPETQALERYIGEVFADQRAPGLTAAAPLTTTGLFLSLHSYGELVLRPWSHTDKPAPNAAGLKAVGDRYAEFTGYWSCQTSASDCLYGADGTTDDWAYGDFGVASHTIEMGNAFFEACDDFDRDVLPGALKVLDYGLRIAHQPYLLAQGPLVTSVGAETAADALPSQVIQVTAGDAFTLTATVESHLAADEQSVEAGAVGGARWTLDAPPWATAVGGPMAAVDGHFGAPGEEVFAQIPTAGWASGRHLLIVQGADAAGTGGAPAALFVDVVAGVVVTPPATPPTTFRLFLPLAAGD